MKLTLEYVLAHGHGTERQFCCPVHDDRNPSASVNVLKGLWYCYRCGARGDLKNTYYELTEDDVLYELDQLGMEPEYYPESWLSLFTSGPVHPYWLSRFTEESCRHFGLGYDASRDVCTYPIRDPGGRLLGVVHRNLDGAGPKYRYPYGVQKTQLLFNYSQDQRDIVYLVEGAMDVVAAWESGYEAFGIYGSDLSEGQVWLLKRVDPKLVVIVLDSDAAGKEGAERAERQLQKYQLESTILTVDPALGKDLGELTIPERITLLDSLTL